MADVSGVASHSIVQKEKRDYTKLDLHYQGIAFFCLISQLKKERKKEMKEREKRTSMCYIVDYFLKSFYRAIQLGNHFIWNE